MFQLLERIHPEFVTTHATLSRQTKGLVVSIPACELQRPDVSLRLNMAQSDFIHRQMCHQSRSADVGRSG